MDTCEVRSPLVGFSVSMPLLFILSDLYTESGFYSEYYQDFAHLRCHHRHKMNAKYLIRIEMAACARIELSMKQSEERAPSSMPLGHINAISNLLHSLYCRHNRFVCHEIKHE